MAAEPLDNAERILVLAPNWLGDAVMATPALRALRRRFPEAAITVVGRRSICEMLEGLPFIDHLAEVPQRPGAAAMRSLAKRIAPEAPDLCVILPHSFRAALFAKFANAKRRLGYNRGGRTMLLTDGMLPHEEHNIVTPVYMAREYLELLEGFGVKDDNKGLELAVSDEAVAAVKKRLKGRGPIVGIAPGAAFGPSKCWPAERYAAVADALTKQAGARCVLITGPGEEKTREAVIEAAHVKLIETHDHDPSIENLKATMSQIDLLVGNDSGPRHVAIAFGKPVVCIMGPTSPLYTDSPWERGELLRVDVNCGPCQKPTCAQDHRCMTAIEPELVIETALAQLG